MIMRWDVSQPGNEEREGSPGESHFYNRLEATACKTSFINCRMNREERKAGLGLEWPHRPCSRVYTLSSGNGKMVVGFKLAGDVIFMF